MGCCIEEFFMSTMCNLIPVILSNSLIKYCILQKEFFNVNYCNFVQRVFIIWVKIFFCYSPIETQLSKAYSICGISLLVILTKVQAYECKISSHNYCYFLIILFFSYFSSCISLNQQNNPMDKQYNVKSNLIQPFNIEEPQQQQPPRASTIPGEHHYDSYYEYVMSLIGFAVGFGSFWRFPYLVYKNGGGAFLIPYFIALFLVGIPMLYLETVIGQMHQRSVPFIYERINKGLKLLGASFLFVCFHLAGYYNIILTYSYRFLMSAFVSPLPFADESALENTYFHENVLHMSESINEFGSIDPLLFFIYMLSLYICYLVIKNGVKTSGKIIIFTAMVPYIFFVILGVRGLFLQGAMQGLSFLFLPNFKKLLSFEIWIDAIVQVFYQMTLACSGIINLSSMKPKKQKFMFGIYVIPLSISVCGLLCAVNIFTYLGHFTHESNLKIEDLQLLGAELSFNVFPKALAILPFPNLWIFCFFLAMVFLGIDSEFGFLESLFCYLKDQIHRNQGTISIFGLSFTLQRIQKFVIFLILFFCPFLTSQAGIYYLTFFDSFIVNIPFTLGAVIEYFLFVYIFPFSQLQDQAYKNTGEKAPKWIQNLIQGKLLIGILLGNLALACINQFFYFFKYSLGFYIFGWTITSYPFIIAYIYWLRNKEDKSRLTFKEIKKLT